MGGQKAIALFYRYLSNIAPITVIGTSDNDTEPEPFAFLPLLDSSITRYIDPWLFFRVKKAIRQHGFTHLILEHPYYAWLGWLLKKSTGITLVVRSHNIESVRFKSIRKWWWKILWSYEKFIHRSADMSFFITDEDKTFAIKNFNLDPLKCLTVTYGFEMNTPPSAAEKKICRLLLEKKYSITSNTKILLFNGTLSYKPNADALDNIIHKISPSLLRSGFDHIIIICGRDLPGRFNELQGLPNIRYAGFVDDIIPYFKGADIFINPVTGGGGIKTKLVEAIGYGLSGVSAKSGAMGIPAQLTRDKMMIVADDDWNAFSAAISALDITAVTSQEFFEYFYWGNIAEKALDELKKK